MFVNDLAEAIQRKNSFLCVGLDPSIDELPPNWEPTLDGLVGWTKEFISCIAPYAPVVKPNFGFYLEHGSAGVEALEDITRHSKENDLLCVLDLKPGDGKKSARKYAEATIGDNQFAEFDAVTLETSIADPGFGEYVAVSNATGRGVFLVVRTSFKNPESRIERVPCVGGFPLWHEYAGMVQEAAHASPHGDWGFSNIGAVVGATRAKDAAKARELMPHSMFLVPGFGTQGGKASGAVAGANDEGAGIIASSSSGIMNAWMTKRGCEPLDCAEEAAVEARDALNVALLN